MDRGIDAIWRVFDLTGSLRTAADLARCLHRTVARLVAGQEAGGIVPRVCQPSIAQHDRHASAHGVTRWILAGTVQLMGAFDLSHRNHCRRRRGRIRCGPAG